jgi:DNA-binding response OmpR family regulator
MAKKLLLIDDDALMRRSLSFNLEKAGYHIQTGSNAEDGIQIAKHEKPDLVILDIGLPGMDGLEAVRIFREQIGIPVIFLTARRRELDEILGLEMGADDYVTKPFDLDVLNAHIKAVLRRAQITPPAIEPAILQVGDITIDNASHTLTVGNRPIDLSPKEFDLLNVLAARAGQVVTSEDLLMQVWGAEYEGQPQVVYVNIRWLRQKIEADPDHPERILTVHSVGYKLVPKGT